LTLAEANSVVGQWHRHHTKVSGHRFSIGAMRDGELVGAAIISRPVAGWAFADYASESNWGLRSRRERVRPIRNVNNGGFVSFSSATVPTSACLGFIFNADILSRDRGRGLINDNFSK
jgi:hypothetical protein